MYTRICLGDVPFTQRINKQNITISLNFLAYGVLGFEQLCERGVFCKPPSSIPPKRYHYSLNYLSHNTPHNFSLFFSFQCAHAAVGAVECVSRQDPNTFKQWRLHGQPKVVVKADDTAMLYVTCDFFGLCSVFEH